MLTLKIIMNLKKFLHPNIMTSMKCITLKYLRKINHYPYSITACSLNKNFDDLQHLLSSTKKVFDAIRASESIISMQVFLLNYLNLNNYFFEFTPSETSAGGTILYIANHLSYKCCNVLNIYKNNKLESTFIEVVNPENSNIIVGVIYRHPSMDLADFNCYYLNKLLENISK